jgi:hypothetical protein
VQREAGFTIQVRTLIQMAAATIEPVTGTCDLTPTTSPASSNRKQARIRWPTGRAAAPVGATQLYVCD